MTLPFEYSALGIINAALTYLDWKPTLVSGSSLYTKLFTLLNQALLDTFAELPLAFNQHTYTIYTQPDAEGVSGQVLDRLTVVDSARMVLQRTTAASSASPAGLTWDFTGHWNRRTIVLTDSSGNDYYRTVMDVWQQTVSLVSYDRVSLDRPLPATVAGTLTYKFITEKYPLPVQALNIKHAFIKDPFSFDLEFKTQEQIEDLGIDDQILIYGQPCYVAKADADYIQAPTTIATLRVLILATDSDYTPWVTTDDVAGTFDYVWTLCHAYRNVDDISSLGYRTPLIESNPSPVSTTATTTEGAGAIRLTTPNMDRVLGYGPDSSERDGHSGYFKRFYARRSASQTGASIHLVEDVNRFYLVGESDASEQSFYHDGTPAVDRSVPLRHRPVYQSVRFYPRADSAYKVVLRCNSIPEQLINATDTPPLPESSSRLLVLKLVQAICSGMVDDQTKKASAILEYESLKNTATKNQGRHQATRSRKNLATIHPHRRHNAYPRLGNR